MLFPVHVGFVLRIELHYSKLSKHSLFHHYSLFSPHINNEVRTKYNNGRISFFIYPAFRSYGEFYATDSVIASNGYPIDVTFCRLAGVLSPVNH